MEWKENDGGEMEEHAVETGRELIDEISASGVKPVKEFLQIYPFHEKQTAGNFIIQRIFSQRFQPPHVTAGNLTVFVSLFTYSIPSFVQAT